MKNITHVKFSLLFNIYIYIYIITSAHQANYLNNYINERVWLNHTKILIGCHDYITEGHEGMPLSDATDKRKNLNTRSTLKSRLCYIGDGINSNEIKPFCIISIAKLPLFLKFFFHHAFIKANKPYLPFILA